MNDCKTCALYAVCSRKDVYMKFMSGTVCVNAIQIDDDISYAIDSLNVALKKVENAIDSIQLAHKMSIEKPDLFKDPRVKQVNEDFMASFESELAKLESKRKSLKTAIDILKRFVHLKDERVQKIQIL